MIGQFFPWFFVTFRRQIVLFKLELQKKITISIEIALKVGNVTRTTSWTRLKSLVDFDICPIKISQVKSYQQKAPKPLATYIWCQTETNSALHFDVNHRKHIFTYDVWHLS